MIHNMDILGGVVVYIYQVSTLRKLTIAYLYYRLTNLCDTNGFVIAKMTLLSLGQFLGMNW